MQDLTKILLIEDDEGDTRIIQEMLLEDGIGSFVLQPATTLHAGIDQLAEHAYDVVLLDLALPDSAGIDTLFKLRAQVPDIPIIVLTGIDDVASHGVQAVQMGAQDYLVKGDVDARLLSRSIHYAMERHEFVHRLRRSEEEYRSLIEDVFDTSMVAVIILDADFTVVWCNEATENYFGIEREALLGHDKRKVVQNEVKYIFADPEGFAARLLKAYEANSFTEHFECHVVPQDNRAERWLEHWSQPIRDGIYKGGRIEQYTDITDHKALETAERVQRQLIEAQRDITVALTSTLNLDEVLKRVLNNLGHIVPHDSASVTIREDDHFWVAQSSDGLASQEVTREDELHLEYQHYLDTMSKKGEALLVNDVVADSKSRDHTPRASMGAYMGAPIRWQAEIIGFVNLINETPGTFLEEDRERLKVFADLAAIAIQNARLYNESRELAALQERQHLARELHDSVSQAIFSGRMVLETATKRWETDPPRARELVEEAEELMTTALAEMRILLMELRTNALTQISFKELMALYLRSIEARRAFEMKSTLADVPTLPENVQIALYRIAQEALNNISKHAQASQVEINATYQQDTVSLSICDDGEGFDVSATNPSSLGLKIMQERAHEINATITIDSTPGRGTCIEVQWNYQEQKR
ncbi:MAG: response regulator [Chloroflexi bacterium]|nr:response regulator [Chloroflexota bacterium]